MSAISSSAPGPGDVGQHMCPSLRLCGWPIEARSEEPAAEEWPGPEVNNFSAYHCGRGALSLVTSQWGLTGWWPGQGLYRAPGGGAPLCQWPGSWSAVLLSTNLQGVTVRSKRQLATNLGISTTPLHLVNPNSYNNM